MNTEDAEQKFVHVSGAGPVHEPDIAIELLSLGKNGGNVHLVARVDRHRSPSGPCFVEVYGPEQDESCQGSPSDSIPDGDRATAIGSLRDRISVGHDAQISWVLGWEKG